MLTREVWGELAQQFARGRDTIIDGDYSTTGVEQHRAWDGQHAEAPGQAGMFQCVDLLNVYVVLDLGSQALECRVLLGLAGEAVLACKADYHRTPIWRQRQGAQLARSGVRMCQP
jgi:hypothetical protein